MQRAAGLEVIAIRFIYTLFVTSQLIVVCENSRVAATHLSLAPSGKKLRVVHIHNCDSLKQLQVR